MKTLIFFLLVILIISLNYCGQVSTSQDVGPRDRSQSMKVNELSRNSKEDAGLVLPRLPKVKSIPVDWNKPPDFTFPQIKIWKLEGSEICYPIDGSCKSLPKDKMYCVSGVTYDEALRYGKEFVDYAKSSCAKWGPDSLELAKQKKKNFAINVRRPPLVEESVKVIQTFYLNQIHVSGMHDGKLQMNPYEEVVCFSDRDRERIFDFYAKINRRCISWGI